MDTDRDGSSIRVMPAPNADSAPHDAPQHSSALRRLGPLMGILAAMVLIVAGPWLAQEGIPTESTAPVLSQPPTEPQDPPRATLTLQAFVAAVNDGDLEAATKLMSHELPDVLGLGTTGYPRHASDPGLWVAGGIDDLRVAGFVEVAASQPVVLDVSNCESFADGPQVTIARCAYSTTGPALPGGFRQETGRMFGFVVDGKLAGVSHRIESVTTTRLLD